jgi:hypothetical protein
MNSSSTSLKSGSTEADADDQEGFANHCAEAEAIKIEFKKVADGFAPLGFKGRKEDVINLMAWEIGDLRKELSRVALVRRGGQSG